LSHQASFFKRKLFDSLGLYSKDYKIISDWVFYCKCYLLNRSFLKLNLVLFENEPDGVSSDNKLIEAERSHYFRTNMFGWGIKFMGMLQDCILRLNSRFEKFFSFILPIKKNI
jgi:hypothetical protein